MSKIIVLCSGGMDSILLLHWAVKQYDTVALSIDYGQKHKRELEKAKEWCDTLRVPHFKMAVDMSGLVHSALTSSERAGLYPGVSPWHVPGRNTIFLGLAAALAESMGAVRIWLGANFDDRIANFPDCTQQWVYAMREALLVSASYPIELEAPLLGMRKQTIIALAKAEGITEEAVHSGYAE